MQIINSIMVIMYHMSGQARDVLFGGPSSFHASTSNFCNIDYLMVWVTAKLKNESMKSSHVL